jgi:2-polyprenyl-3-methyl-5-hydroxy-6-metoxy-1,4-benzoquinol methylase
MLKRAFWNMEYGSGKWNFLDATADDCIYQHLEKHARNGAILDLGCGPGNTANELAEKAYSQYVGVDISDVALTKARKRTQEAGRSHKNSFSCGDLLTFIPPQKFDVILFRESLYHVALDKVKLILDRYAQYLSTGGVFIVRLVTNNRYRPKAVLRIIETNFEMVEKNEYGDPKVTVLVVRPRDRYDQ